MAKIYVVHPTPEYTIRYNAATVALMVGIENRAALLVKEARRRSGLTQSALGSRSGTSQPVIHAYEAGLRQPSLPTLARIVEAAGFDLRVDIESRPSDVRPATGSDVPAITELVPRYPYQPPVLEQAVRRAMAGESDTDRWYWDRLGLVETVVAVDSLGEVTGACSYAVDTQDDIGYLLWLAADESYASTKVLVDHALNALKICPVVRACWFATALSIGLEGLPIAHSPVTDQVLRESGLERRDLWLWMVYNGPFMDADGDAKVEATPTGWTVSYRRSGETMAEAEISLHGHLGVLWWLSVDEAHRGRGLGRRLLMRALAHLANCGAEAVMLFVDYAENDRLAAITLYESIGFRTIDHLCSYEKVT